MSEGLIQINKLNYFNGNGDDLVSMPFCSHKFCTTCWRDYLNESLQKNKEERVLISCPDTECVASVGPDTIEKLPEEVNEIYESYVLGSFMESKKQSIKWCPALGCNYAVERHEFQLEDDDESSDLGVVCLCGHIFCWTCQLESHRPMTCKNASIWLNRSMDETRTLNWIFTNTKRCPVCNTPVEKNDDPHRKIVTCICSCRFCWICSRSADKHKRKWDCSVASVPQTKHDYNITHQQKLWEETQEAIEKAKSDLKDREQNYIPKLTKDCSLGKEDITALRKAWMLIVQCRVVLKWICVFDYFITVEQIAKKQDHNRLGDEAYVILSKHEDILNEVMNRAISDKYIIYFKNKLETTTTTTSKYFHYILKSLEYRLSEVEVDVYENENDWFCDHCSFQNSSSDRKCQMCFTSRASPPQH